MIGQKVILSLCDFTGNWSQPYADAGYEVIRIDLKHGQDVRSMLHLGRDVHGILMAPPCTHFSRAGACHWKSKGEAPVLEGLAIVDACLRAVAIYSPEWWVLENPIGRLQDYLGPPKWKFDPFQFGDPYTKRTWLWGHFTPPLPLWSKQAGEQVEPTWSAPGGVSPRDHDRRVLTKQSAKTANCFTLRTRATERSATPKGFSQAFFEANP